MAVMVNAGAQLLENSIAASAADIDLVMVHGYGFPRYRGGPMRFAEESGLDAILAQLKAFAAEDSDRPAASPLLKTLAACDKGWSADTQKL